MRSGRIRLKIVKQYIKIFVFVNLQAMLNRLQHTRKSLDIFSNLMQCITVYGGI